LRLDGLGALGARLSGIADAALASELEAAAEEIRERAAANLNASGGGGSTGALVASLRVSAVADGGYVVGTPLDHGWHREFGSRTRPAAPWLAPAAEDARPGLAARIARRIDATLRRAAPKG
jgi:hypothetical protein